MDKEKIRAWLLRCIICLAPSAVILAVIYSGAGLHMSPFELAWHNDLVFALLVIAFFLPLTKLPLLFLRAEQQSLCLLDDWASYNKQERAAQSELLERRLNELRVEGSLPVVDTIK